MRQIKHVWVWVSGNGWGNSVDGGLGLWGVGRASPGCVGRASQVSVLFCYGACLFGLWCLIVWSLVLVCLVSGACLFGL